MSDTYNETTELLTIYHADTAEERSCTQAEFDETFAPAGWEIIEPIAAPLATISVTHPDTGETRTVSGQEFAETLQAAGWVLTPPPPPPVSRRRRSGLRTEDRR